MVKCALVFYTQECFPEKIPDQLSSGMSDSTDPFSAHKDFTERYYPERELTVYPYTCTAL